MKVTISYYDDTSLTKEEIVSQAKYNYGESVEVKVEPISNDPWDMLHFALQSLITYDQLSILFDSGPLYKEKLVELKLALLDKVENELTNVVLDNEEKVT
jgi:hypothetical protein